MRGFRATEEPFKGARNVLVIGDSYTFGVYVNDNETYPSVMSAHLKKVEPSIRVVNVGYASGFETDQQYAWFQRYYEKINPEVVVWGVFLGNDITGINQAAWKDRNFDGLPLMYLSDDLTVSEDGHLVNRKQGIDTVGVEGIYKVPVLR